MPLDKQTTIEYEETSHSLKTLGDGHEITFDMPLAKQPMFGSDSQETVFDVPLAKKTMIKSDETSHSLKTLKDGHEIVLDIPLARQPLVESDKNAHINVEICDSAEHH